MIPAYDAIVIGAGVNGLVLALRLQRAGLATLVVERAARVGGMARTEEPLLPGFRHNPHANYLGYGAISPIEAAFDLSGAGLRTIVPEAQHGMSFGDGRPPLILYRNDQTERSVNSLRTYSARDARTYAELKAAADSLNASMARAVYSPLSRGSAMPLVEAAAQSYQAVGGGALTDQSARDVIDTLFEADEVRALFYQLSAETGLSLEAHGSGAGFLTFTFWAVGQWRLPVGGMQSYANALAEAARGRGAIILRDASVDRIVVRDGKAVAVEIAGHGRVEARRAIASSAGLHATLIGMLHPTVLSSRGRTAANEYAAMDGPALGGLVFCMRAAPDYRSARWNPDINRCFRTVVGYNDTQGALAHIRDLDARRLPPPAAALRVNSLWDETQAPAGHQVVGGDVLMPAASALTSPDWEEVTDSYIEAFQAVWSQHATNVSTSTILAAKFSPPARHDRVLRLGEGTGQYRTEVQQLYLCGAATHPGGGAHGACGYNAFGAIAEDLELNV